MATCVCGSCWRDWRSHVPPVALLAGNHDHPHAAAFRAGTAGGRGPGDSAAGRVASAAAGQPSAFPDGRLAGKTAARLAGGLADRVADGPVLVAVHHPPGPIGDRFFDTIALRDGAELMRAAGPVSPGCGAWCSATCISIGKGHAAGQPQLPMWGCPSTLRSFGPVQPCTLGRPDDPGGRLLELGPRGEIRQRLLRWSSLIPLPSSHEMVGIDACSMTTPIPFSEPGIWSAWCSEPAAAGGRRSARPAAMAAVAAPPTAPTSRYPTKRTG